MKKLYILCYIAMLICVLGTAALLVISPDIIPVHFNFAGEVDRFGSKYENLLWPFFSILIGGILMFTAKKVGQKEGEKDGKTILYVALITLIFFMILGFYFMIKAIQYNASEPGQMSVDIMKFIGIFLGIFQIILGYLMPKVSRNSVFGLKTRWSLSSDRVWRKSQRFCGFSSIVCGILMMLAGIFVPDEKSIFCVVLLMIAWALIATGASYYYYKKDNME